MTLSVLHALLHITLPEASDYFIIYPSSQPCLSLLPLLKCTTSCLLLEFSSHRPHPGDCFCQKACLDQVILIATSRHMESYTLWPETLKCSEGVSVPCATKDNKDG